MPSGEVKSFFLHWPILSAATAAADSPKNYKKQTLSTHEGWRLCILRFDAYIYILFVWFFLIGTIPSLNQSKKANSYFSFTF